jgi:hypothetical protein
MLTPSQINAMGFVVSGDVDGLTIYTDRYGRKIAYPAAPPKKPPTIWQLAWRRNLAMGMRLWRDLSNDERHAYRRVCDAASLCMLGHNLWLHVYLAADYELLSTLAEQYAITLTPPPEL